MIYNDFFATWILIVATVLLVLQIGVTIVKVIFSVETGDVFTTAFDAYSVCHVVFGVMADLSLSYVARFPWCYSVKIT